MDEQTSKLDTHFIKSDDFRTVHGSGFYGGFTPSGYINFFVYTERVPIPKQISFQMDPRTGEIGDEIERDGKKGLVREVQFGVLFDVQTAGALVDWLTQKLNAYHQAQAESSK